MLFSFNWGGVVLVLAGSNFYSGDFTCSFVIYFWTLFIKIEPLFGLIVCRLGANHGYICISYTCILNLFTNVSQSHSYLKAVINSIFFNCLAMCKLVTLKLNSLGYTC